jgi:hypothetical protein
MILEIIKFQGLEVNESGFLTKPLRLQ